MARNKFDVDEELEQEFSWKDFKRLARYVVPYKASISKVLFTIILSQFSWECWRQFSLRLRSTRRFLNKIKCIAVLDWCRFCWSHYLMIGLCMRYRIYHITNIGQDVLKDMRYDIFEHLQRLPFSYFDTRPHGKILIRVVNYINTLSDLLSNGLINLISDIFNVVITLIFMLVIDVKLTLYSLALLPVLLCDGDGDQEQAAESLSEC
jgi:ATP-binding cassette subfamily B multidrug efflux pump